MTGFSSFLPALCRGPASLRWLVAGSVAFGALAVFAATYALGARARTVPWRTLRMVLAAALGLGVAFVSRHPESTGIPVLYTVGPLTTAFLLGLVEDRRLTRRRRAIALALPWLLDVLAVGLTAGLDFPGALKTFADHAPRRALGPLVEEIERLLADLALGHTRKFALLAFGRRATGGTTRAEEDGDAIAIDRVVQGLVEREDRGDPTVDAVNALRGEDRDRPSGRTTPADVPLLPVLLVATSCAVFVAPVLPRLLRALTVLTHTS